MRGSRVQAVSSELGNERLDIVIWDDDPAQLLVNSMGPAEITSIVLDEAKGTMEVAVTQDTLAQAIGKSGQNVRLSSQITGWKLNVIDQESAVQKGEEESATTVKSLVGYLDVDEDVAKALADQGYINLDLISSASASDIANIEGFDEEIAELLIGRSKEALLTLAMELTSDNEDDSEDLMSVEGMEMSIALELNQKGITDREELAEQSVDELIEIIDISEEEAAELIMKARAHWFED
jgi:N utilization substance protein A